MESAGNWSLIESDPGLFTQLIKKFGATGVQVEEIWSLEEHMFENLRPVHGLIFLFKYNANEVTTGQVVTDPKVLENIYFAKQVINNACATQAVISLLLNCDHEDVLLGQELTNLKEFSMSFDPAFRGLTLSNSQTIRAAHNSMACQNMFEMDDSTPGKEEAAYHFVGYIPIRGRVYELDGLREGPIDHGPVGPNQDWLSVITPVIMKRMALYSEGEIHFNLMALISDRGLVYRRQLHALLNSPRASYHTTAELEQEAERLQLLDREAERLQLLIQYEENKQARYEDEVARRRHNYMPFIITLLQILAEEKKLTPLLNKMRPRRGAKRLNT